MSTSEENKNKHIFATFLLRGEGLDPQEVTSILGITPSKSFKRGDWRTESEKWTRNLWSLTSQNEIQSDHLSEHIGWLLDQFDPVIDELNEILRRNGVESEISCFWIFQNEHEEVELSSRLMKRIAACGSKLTFDMYSPD